MDSHSCPRLLKIKIKLLVYIWYVRVHSFQVVIFWCLYTKDQHGPNVMLSWPNIGSMLAYSGIYKALTLVLCWLTGKYTKDQHWPAVGSMLAYGGIYKGPTVARRWLTGEM